MKIIITEIMFIDLNAALSEYQEINPPASTAKETSVRSFSFQVFFRFSSSSLFFLFFSERTTTRPRSSSKRSIADLAGKNFPFVFVYRIESNRILVESKIFGPTFSFLR